MRKTLLIATLAAGGFNPLAPGRDLSAQEPTARRTYSVPHVLEAVGKAIAQPMPRDRTAADRKDWSAQTEWLRRVQARVEALGTRTGILAPREGSTGQATGRRQHEPIQIRKEMEALQQAIEQEARRFTTLSNVMKTRHDAVMNAIRNMKA